jgi:hypothetical protein
MKTNVVIILVILLVVVNIIAIRAWPFGFRNLRMQQGFQNPTVRVGSTNPSMPVVRPVPPMAMGNPSMPTMPAMPTMPTMPTTPTAPTAPATPAVQMPMGTMPAQTSTPAVAGSTIPMLPITVPNTPAPVVAQPTIDMCGNIVQGFQNVSDIQGAEYRRKEGFTTRYVDNAGGAKDKYQPIGAFDGVNLPTGNNVSSWRYTSPDEKLLGAEFEVGDDSLFMFKNNQCKPECCGSSFSCSGGCVCSTPNQRQYLASRGGNVSKPDDNV